MSSISITNIQRLKVACTILCKYNSPNGNRVYAVDGELFLPGPAPSELEEADRDILELFGLTPPATAHAGHWIWRESLTGE